ncbi:MAG TPA: hypothetical protein PLM56_18800 [Cyclobacteriaceae bacterium]|nr:hypothetical protein [Cyclobacteriaceae bacterium]
MGKRILIFNIIYYAVTLFFIKLGRDDASSSLGYGFFIIGFWVIAAITLIFFLIKRVIQPNSIIEKIGIFTATPVLSIVVIWSILSFQENASSEYYFNKDGYRYRVITYHHKNTLNVKRIEYYRSQNAASEAWAKDSTWVYFSESGDTLKRIKYKNDIEIK